MPRRAIGVPGPTSGAVGPGAGTRYGELAAREVAALGDGALVALAVTAVAVHRRRPG